MTALNAPDRLIDRLARLDDDMLLVLVEQAGVGVAVIDHLGMLVRVNASLRRMVDPACDLTRGCPAFDIFTADCRATVQAGAMRAVWAAGLLCPFYATLRPRPGATLHVPVMVSAVRLLEADGVISGAILEISDLSAQRHLETQLAQSQKFQAVGQLAAGIAHDFNNLLTVIIGAVDETLQRMPADPLMADPRMAEDLQQIRTSADRGADLIQHLLAFSRQQALQPIVLTIDALVQKLAPLLRGVVGSNVSLDLDLHTAPRQVLADPTQLDRVLVNLAVNARHAMPDGGRLVIRTRETLLEHSSIRGTETIPAGSYVLMDVSDTGIGIPSAMLPQIFDPFFTTRRDRGGSGLGLSTVLGIVRQSGGYLDVESEAGLGTSFHIYLPRYDAPGPPEPPANPPEFPARQNLAAPAGRLVLLVDDEPGVRRLAARALIKTGWTVLEAESGEDALAKVQASPRHLAGLRAVITDLVMPGMDGWTLMRSLRELRPGLPAILTSGYTNLVHEPSLPGNVVVVAKPYGLDSLLETLMLHADPELP